MRRGIPRRMASRPSAEGLMYSRRQAYALAAPGIGLVFVVLYLPAVYGAYRSLFDIRFLVAGDYVGLANYAYLLLDQDFVVIVGRTAMFTAAAVALTLALSLAIANWIDNLGRTLALTVQIVVILPWIISNTVGALLFRWTFINEIGLTHYVVGSLGLGEWYPLQTTSGAMALMIGSACWRNLGFGVVVLLAGLKGIPGEYYEAAKVDGATAWQRFALITMPLLKTPLLIAVIVLSLANLSNVETPLIITGGGPAGSTNVLPLYLYQSAFADYDFNTALALAVGMFLANILLVVGYVKLVRWRV
jgi:multiple sugar transport system permease protein